MNPHYNHNYTREQIEVVLNKIKDCVKNDSFSISQNNNRTENKDFIAKYNIRHDKQKSILLQLRVEDFCHSLKNTNVGFEHELLYVFAPTVILHNIDDSKDTVTVYIKFNIIDRLNGNYTIVISFHELNKDIDYLFK